MSGWVVFVFLGDSITAGFQQGPGYLPPRYYPFTNMLESYIRMKLKEMESDVPYGLGCKESKLAQFAADLADGTLNLFPEYHPYHYNL